MGRGRQGQEGLREWLRSGISSCMSMAGAAIARNLEVGGGHRGAVPRLVGGGFCPRPRWRAIGKRIQRRRREAAIEVRSFGPGSVRFREIEIRGQGRIPDIGWRSGAGAGVARPHGRSRRRRPAFARWRQRGLQHSGRRRDRGRLAGSDRARARQLRRCGPAGARRVEECARIDTRIARRAAAIGQGGSGHGLEPRARA